MPLSMLRLTSLIVANLKMHRQMIDYGEEQVEKVPPREIVFKGLSITRLRYLKAAFIYAASSREEEIGHITATGTWPDRVVGAISGKVKSFMISLARYLRRSLDLGRTSYRSRRAFPAIHARCCMGRLR